MQLANTHIELDETDDRLKITYPLKRNPILVITYTILSAAWLIGLLAFLWILFRNPRDTAELPTLIRVFWFIAVILWIYVWARPLGKRILRWWQFNLADRELLFFDEKRFIVRRPVSIFGTTEAFDRQHINPFYTSDEHNCLGFQYGNAQHVMFALSLPEPEQQTLLAYLNNRYFPHYDPDDDDDDDDDEYAH